MTENRQITDQDDEINIFNLLVVLIRRWKMIVGLTALAGLVSAIIAISMPNRYQATAKVITLQRQVILPMNTMFQKSSPIVGTQKPFFQFTNLPIMQDVLVSGPVLDALTKEFQFRSPERLLQQYKVNTAKSGTIEISTEDTDPKRAAAIANAAVKELGRTAYALNLISSPKVTTERDLELLGDDVSSVIKLLQPAAPPTTKIKPKRTLIVLFATVSSAFAGMLLAFLLEWLKKLQPEDRIRWEAIKSDFRGN